VPDGVVRLFPHEVEPCFGRFLYYIVIVSGQPADDGALRADGVMEISSDNSRVLPCVEVRLSVRQLGYFGLQWFYTTQTSLDLQFLPPVSLAHTATTMK